LVLVGLFSRTPKDPDLKNNIKKFKEFKKLLKAKKVQRSSQIRHRIITKST
jgi:hypothetical protein